MGGRTSLYAAPLMASPTSEPSGASSSLTTALRLLRERWWVLALCTVLGLAAFVVRDLRKTDQYEATATLLFGTAGSNVSGLLNSAASNVSADPQRDQSTTLLLVQSSSVADRVREALKYPGPSADLAGAIKATARADANLIDITATDPDPARAALVANTFAQQYQRFRRDSDQAGVRQGIDSLQAQYSRTPVIAQVQRQTLRDSITALRQAEATITGGVQLVDRATPSGAPASPQPKRDGLLGAILGLALGGALVFGFDLRDRRLKVVADFEAAYRTTALVAVPLGRRDTLTASRGQAVLEPFRILRVSLGQASSLPRPQVVLVTSAATGEGKSSTASGLARAIAFAGRTVVLVELDLRRPTFHHQFGLPRETRGLSDVLQGHADVTDVLVPGDEELQTLQVIPAGGLPSDSAELLSGPRMAAMVSELAERFDAVVLDAPPLLPVADTHAVLDVRQIDTCLIVGRAYLTNRDQAARARTILLQHGRARYGLVVNGLRRDEGTYDYAYDADERPSVREVLNQPIG